jgi:hypothetical protein
MATLATRLNIGGLRDPSPLLWIPADTFRVCERLAEAVLPFSFFTLRFREMMRSTRDSLTAHVYTSLEPDAISFVVLAAGGWDDQIVCMSQYGTIKSLLHEALSYSRGILE